MGDIGYHRYTAVTQFRIQETVALHDTSDGSAMHHTQIGSQHCYNRCLYQLLINFARPTFAHQGRPSAQPALPRHFASQLHADSTLPCWGDELGKAECQ